MVIKLEFMWPSMESTLVQWNTERIHFDKEEKHVLNGLENDGCLQVKG